MNNQSTKLFSSIIAMCITVVIVSQSITNIVIKPRLYDGTINELGRYSFTFDAYEYIDENTENAVIAVGSSKMREIFDGTLFSENTVFEGDFYNLAYAGDRPYVRMIEIDSIIAIKPRLVILEFGPNVLSKLNTPVDDATAGRMSQLMSLNNKWHQQTWEDILLEEDKEILPLERIEQINYLAEYAPKALESALNYELEIEEPIYSCDKETGNVRCVPEMDEVYYKEYIQYPIQFSNSLERIKAGNSSITIDEFYGPRLDKYINSSYHNPEGHYNKNQMAFEFIIDSLRANDIEVILVGLPYNPVLIDRLADSQWNYYNQTLERYDSFEDVTVVDFVWSDFWMEEDFNDFTHASRKGELKFAGNLCPLIDELFCGDC